MSLWLGLEVFFYIYYRYKRAMLQACRQRANESGACVTSGAGSAAAAVAR